MFEVNDVVEAFGVMGVVNRASEFCVTVYFENGLFGIFFQDGRQYRWHKTPALQLIRRPEVVPMLRLSQ